MKPLKLLLAMLLLLLSAGCETQNEKTLRHQIERLQAGTDNMQQQINALQAKLGGLEEAHKESKDSAEQTEGKLQRQIADSAAKLKALRERMIANRIGLLPNLSGITVYTSKEKVLKILGIPREKTPQTSSGKLVKWAYSGATVYFLNDQVFQINALSDKLTASFGVNVGDPLADLTLDDRTEYVLWVDKDLLLRIIAPNGSISVITITRGTS